MGDSHKAQTGLACGVGAYTIWGLTPLLFNGIKSLGNVEILALRMLVSAALLILLISFLRGWRSIGNIIRQPRLLSALALSTVLIIANWLLFIMATRTGHVMESSLGFFINPLFNVAFGMIFLGERLRAVQWTAIVMAAGAVAFLGISQGTVPWMALTMAGTFSVYGLIRKIVPVSPFDGLAIENFIFVPFATLILLIVPLSPPSSFTSSNIMLLALLAPATVLPFFLFAAAAQRLQYSTVGVIQYIGPSLQFLVALHFGEAFDRAHAIAFGFIWTALAIYAVDSLRYHGYHVRNIRRREAVS